MRFLSVRMGPVIAATLALAAPAMAQTKDIAIALGSGSLVAATARVADALGLFEKNGLKPKFTTMDNANAAATAIVSRSADAAVAGPVELIVTNGRGQKVVTVATAYSGLGGTLILSKAAAEKAGVPPGAPVAARLKALDGLIIAAPSPTATYKVAFDGSAKAEGATIRFTYMAMTAMPAALESGAVQGFIASAPVWGQPVLKGTGVAWISGPKGDLPAAHAPVTSAIVLMMRAYVDANPDAAKKLAAVFAGLARMIDEKPAEVKAAVAKIYPDLQGESLDLVFASESAAWKARPMTVQDLKQEIAFVKATGAQLPEIDALDPATLLP